jgi:hypothetical protein
MGSTVRFPVTSIKVVDGDHAILAAIHISVAPSPGVDPLPPSLLLTRPTVQRGATFDARGAAPFRPGHR